MIAYVSGRVAAVTLSTAVVEVGGVGLELNCTPNTIASLRVGEQARLPSTLVVREDSMTLFGFTDDDEKEMFSLLQTASGVGPKLAQAALAVLSPDALREAITGEQVSRLTKVPGIGQKGAQKIIVELKDRVGPARGTRPGAPASAGGDAWRDQVHQGLVGLGWSTKEAEKAVEAVAPEAGELPDVGALLRAALRTLSKA
jgi:Holliday junction DNA helicase RuvA